MILLGAVADDVTGAADLCSTLVREGLRTVQVLGDARDLELPDVEAVVVALKSRTAPVDRAVRESTDALERLVVLGARQILFKYCSTFDSTPEGNIGPVADALLDALGADITVVCPAYPENGRTVYRGHLFVNLVRVLGRQTHRPVSLVPYDVVADGAAAIVLRLDELRRAGVAYAVVDALDDAQLRAVGEACAGLRLVTGGSGVARGLPANFGTGAAAAAAHAQRLEAPPVDGPAVVLAGSCSQATNEQVERMAARYPAIKVDVADTGGLDALADAALARLGDGAVLVYSTAPPDEVARVQELVGPEEASSRVESLLGELACRLVAGGARRLVLAGGETSAAVLQRLGVRALAVGDEIAPGVPWMTSLGEPRLAVALKSGNFGGPDFFLEALGVAG